MDEDNHEAPQKSLAVLERRKTGRDDTPQILRSMIYQGKSTELSALQYVKPIACLAGDRANRLYLLLSQSPRLSDIPQVAEINPLLSH